MSHDEALDPCPPATALVQAVTGERVAPVEVARRRPCPACDGCGYTESPLKKCSACAETGLVPVIATPEPLTISVSEYATLRKCPRRYLKTYVEWRRPDPSGEQAWGSALHRGLEALFGAMSRQGKPDAGHAVFCALTPGTDEQGRPYTPPADPYARAALRAMLRAYAAVWGPSDAERYEVLAVELPFNLPILTARGRESVNRGSGQRGSRREGRIDAVVRERDECPDCGKVPGFECGSCNGCGMIGPGRTWVLEHKSTGRAPSDERYWTGIEIDLQPAVYFDAASILGYQPAGVLYDVVRRPDFDEPKAEPKRAPKTQECEACEGDGVFPDPAPDVPGASGPQACGVCAGKGRVPARVAYSNPRFGESAAAYEERLYRLVTGADEPTPGLAEKRVAQYFGRRKLTITPAQAQEAREDFRAAALEIRWRERTSCYPRVADRYVCAGYGAVCPFLSECGRVAVVEDDRREGVE